MPTYPINQTRREFLASCGVAAAGFATARFTTEATAAETEPAIIDCHAHIYSEDEKTYPVIEKPYRPPEGKGTLAHLRREMKAAGVRSAVAVHTFTFYGFDNRFVADA